MLSPQRYYGFQIKVIGWAEHISMLCLKQTRKKLIVLFNVLQIRRHRISLRERQENVL
jgi:hypothetical protein